MRLSKRNVFKMVLCFMVLISIAKYAEASTYSKYFALKRSDKLYPESQITKGKKEYKKYTARGLTNYQFIKISGNKIYLRPQKGVFESGDPYFSKKRG